MTVQKLFDMCWARHWNKPRYHASGWAREVRGYWTRCLAPTFSQKPLEAVTPKVIRAWRDKFESMPTSANRSLEILSRLFRFAEEEELIPLGANPCRIVRAFPERKRERYATDIELAAIGKKLAAEAIDCPREVAFCMLLAFTGARPRSISRARIEDLERIGDTGILRFSGKTTEKTGLQECVTIPQGAMKFLDILPKSRNGLLLGDVSYRRFWERVRREAGCPDLWIRDLRRTFATVGLSNGIKLDLIGELLNHQSPTTTKRYAKLLPTARIRSATIIAERIQELMKGPT